ncbi:MAG: hypothetical protein ACXAAO_11815 [Candidatus Thorarchaeota archaeon]|jgi:hypothetical protein
MMSDEMEIERVAHIFYDAIFQNESSVEIEGEIYPIEKSSKSKVRFVKYDNLTYIEQNPFKSSRWAKEAQEGHQIMWVMRGRQYLARIRDGKFLDLKKK